MVFFKRRRTASTPPINAARMAEGLRVYAVGDIHGRDDLLEKLLASIAADRADGQATRMVYLGDYIDRGTASRAVIERLYQASSGGEADCLMGNHEAMLLGALDGQADWDLWLTNGGVETMFSYGLDVRDLVRAGDFDTLRERTLQAIPSEHIAFLRGLSLKCEIGDYFFCHAGVRPGVALDRQQQQDLIWIRQDFTGSSAYHGKRIVHGHTPVMEPEILPNRINIDTGAYLTNRLSCVVLEGEEVRVLHT